MSDLQTRLPLAFVQADSIMHNGKTCSTCHHWAGWICANPDGPKKDRSCWVQLNIPEPPDRGDGR